MIEFGIPVLVFAAGVLCLRFSKQIGVAFCRMGKASWRMNTFGLTDMGRLYPEEKAPRIFKIFGVALILFSVPWGVFGVLSFSGPGTFAAIRESRLYLNDTYGDSNGGWSFSAKSAPSGEGNFVVRYRYGDHRGTLLAPWKGDRYSFGEVTGEH
jgi:hypothetical protein